MSRIGFRNSHLDFDRKSKSLSHQQKEEKEYEYWSKDYYVLKQDLDDLINNIKQDSFSDIHAQYKVLLDRFKEQLTQENTVQKAIRDDQRVTQETVYAHFLQYVFCTINKSFYMERKTQGNITPDRAEFLNRMMCVLLEEKAFLYARTGFWSHPITGLNLLHAVAKRFWKSQLEKEIINHLFSLINNQLPGKFIQAGLEELYFPRTGNDASFLGDNPLVVACLQLLPVRHKPDSFLTRKILKMAENSFDDQKKLRQWKEQSEVRAQSKNKNQFCFVVHHRKTGTIPSHVVADEKKSGPGPIGVTRKHRAQ